MLIGMGHRSGLIMGLVKSWLSMFSLSVHHMISKNLKQVLLNKAVLCLGANQDMVIK